MHGSTIQTALTDVVVVPGIGGSGPEHWQSRWETAHPGWRRLRPSSWDEPDLADWHGALDACEPVGSLVVAHSLGCLALASWLVRRPAAARPRGVVLVAPPDPSGPAFPAAAATFTEPVDAPLGVPALVLASTDDPYSSLEHACARAGAWGAGLVDLGPVGHVNAASGLAAWRTGLDLVAAFDAGAQSSGWSTAAQNRP